VYRTPLLVLSLTPSEGPHHSNPDTLTLAADKITNSQQTVPPDAPHSHPPAYMAEMIEFTATSSSQSASPLLYRKATLKTKFGEQAFSHASPAAWNSLPDYIQSESITKHFKKLLKTYLFTVILTLCRNIK